MMQNTLVRHFINANGSHLTAHFNTQKSADDYVPPEGAFETPLRPSKRHEWVNGGWVEQPPAPPVKQTPDPRTVLLDKMLDEYAAKVAGDAAAPVDLKAAAALRVKDMVTP